MRGDKTVATQLPITDRELAELDGGLRKNFEKRQEETNARLATIVARFADEGDIARLLRGAARNYTWAKFGNLVKGRESAMVLRGCLLCVGGVVVGSTSG